MSIESQPSIVHSHQLNYKPVQQANPKYRFLRVPLNNLTGSSATISATSTQLLEFKLPTSVYNLSKSFVSYSVTLPNTSAAYNWIAEDTWGIASNVFFGTASGLDVCNLNYASRYVKIARKIKTKQSDFRSNDELSALYPATGATIYPVSGQNASNDFAGGSLNFEPVYLTVGAVGNAAPGTAGVITRNKLFPLSGIPDTIFSVDKDLYIPTDVYLRVTAGPGNQFAFTSTAVGAPATNTAAVIGDIGLSNIFLYLAIETNDLITQSVMSAVMSSGLKINLPYTTSFRNSSNGTVANINIPLTSQYGKKLKQVLHTVWHGTESGNTVLDCGNYNGTKIASYNTYLNNRQLQDAPVTSTALVVGTSSSANFHDWRENVRFVEDTVIANRAIYAQNWFHLDRFYEDNKGSVIPEENRVDGIDLTTPVQWSLASITANGAWNHYTFITCNRELIIDSTGIRFNV